MGLKVDIEVDGEEEEYFLKVRNPISGSSPKICALTLNSQIIEQKEWVDMARAEYESQKALYEVIPDHVIPPVAWGIFKHDEGKAFYLTEFRDLRPKVPSLSDFLSIVKKLHHTSVSPNGFGFHCVSEASAEFTILGQC